MTIENGIRLIAGTLVMVSVVLTVIYNQWWLILAFFVALNLIQSVFTGFCPAIIILKKLGFRDVSCCAAKEGQ